MPSLALANTLFVNSAFIPLSNREFPPPSTWIRACINIARSEQSSHTPGGSHQRLKHFQRKDKIIKDLIILNQVVSEKTLMKNVHMCYIRVTVGKIEILKKEGKIMISTLIFIYTI